MTQQNVKTFSDELYRGVQLLRKGKADEGIAVVTIAVAIQTHAAFVVTALELDKNTFSIHLHWAGSTKRLPTYLMQICDRVDVYEGTPTRIKCRTGKTGKLSEFNEQKE